MIHTQHNTMTLYSLATNYASVVISLHTDMCILLCIIRSHRVICSHRVVCSHRVSVVIVLPVVTRSRHLNHDVAHTYVLLLVFCFLCSASCILLHTHAVVILICVFCSESLVATVLSVFTVSCRS